ncbi:MAG: hypothetical protein OHK93_001170 [Ramalina farinacea]|uniref:PXA domain-containing protein n=1 Tax=Ramalina farinacea TaxID=258253 RepID=A0AA43QRT2_9LECA|nr:hypothetical protein [Ramalina farinacea]
MAEGAKDDIAVHKDSGQDEQTNGTVLGVASDALKPGKEGIAPPATEISDKARNLTTQILDFLSNASNETLGACAVGLGATTYLVLGRLGLVLIGAVGGVVLHATWEGNGDNGGREETGVDTRKRKEKSLDIVQRVLELPRDQAMREEEPEAEDLNNPKPLDFSGFRPDTKSALEAFTEAIVRDYVNWWYKPILPDDQSFAKACNETLTGFLLSVSSQLSRKRPADVFLDFLTNSSSIVIVFLSELSGALAASRISEPEVAINDYLTKNPSSSLANVLDKEQQKRKLKAVADDILQRFLDTGAYACDPVKTFLREVLAGLILDMTIASCSRADFINEWIIYSLEEGETTELVQALDNGVSSAAQKDIVKNAAAAANGTVANGNAKSISPEDVESSKLQHKRTVSRAEEAMEEAMREAQRMNDMIAAEEARRAQSTRESAPLKAPSTEEDSSDPILDGEELERGPTISDETHNVDGAPAVSSPQPPEPSPSFKSFDQILSDQTPTALKSQSSAPPVLTLHKANVSIFDDAVPGEKGTIRSKPVAEYLLQIEPSTSSFPGWMIARKYPEFESLHEILRRISVISGVAAFTERHPTLPAWKGKTKSALRIELEKYLQDALSFQRLAESEGMKRFLEKDQHAGRASPSANKGLGFPTPAAFETMGKGMLDVLASAPKGAATGGKAIAGGVTGVLGGIGSLGQKRQSSKQPVDRARGSASVSNISLSRTESGVSVPSQDGRASEDVFRQSSQSSPRSPSRESTVPPASTSAGQTRAENASAETSGALATGNGTPQMPSVENQSARQSDDERDQFDLPPPPSEISDDYSTLASSHYSLEDGATIRTSTSTASTTHSPSRKSTASSILPHLDANVIDFPNTAATTTNAVITNTAKSKPSMAFTPLTISETSVAVELFFATINELYTLSSAWTLRLTLLNTAKSFLLRGGANNANLEAIRHLLQSTLIDSCTTDAGIAGMIQKTRENALPTEEELKTWPAPPNEEEKEARRKKARKLLVEKGMPAALTSVMGSAASGECLGKVFDCLQVPEVARGLVFALTLQGVRAVVQ